MSLLAASSGKSSGSGYGLLIFPLILVAGYLLLMRPARNRQRQMAQTRSQITPGVEVVTTAGLIATVVETDDETVTLEIAPGVHSRFLRQAVVRVVEEPAAPEAESIPEEIPESIPPAESIPETATDDVPPGTPQT